MPRAVYICSMKNPLSVLLMLIALSSVTALAQTNTSKLEKSLTDSLCNCVSKLDAAKITTKEQAVAAYTQCVGKHVDLLQALAEEKGVTMDDTKAMEAIGVDLAKNLMKQNCEVFTKLAMTMANDEPPAMAAQSTTGKFKRIDVKGFNYLVLTDKAGSEKSFLWLHEFPGSDKFMGPTTRLAGKSFKITWQEIEVYLPAAKGYYKVKEITAVEAL